MSIQVLSKLSNVDQESNYYSGLTSPYFIQKSKLVTLAFVWEKWIFFIYLFASFAAVCLKGDQIVQQNSED